MTALVQPIISIPLNKLVAWNGNVRKTGETDGIEELRASIAAHGVLQSLIVKKAKQGKFAVVAGKRRHLVLSALASEGEIAPDAPVPCHVMTAAADATEISLTENVVRAPMHPADQFEAFRDLVDSGSTPADIAARFGIAESAVKKRLKLARVSPTVFEAYRDGALSLEQVQAFTVCDDHAAQDRVFGDLSQWNGDPDDIRSALTQDDIAATDRRARFVTLAAYEQAGGGIGLGRLKECFRVADTLDRRRRDFWPRVILLGQAVDLLDVEDGIALHVMDFALGLVALVILFGARDGIRIDHQRALLALPDVGVKLGSLAEGHPDRGGKALRDGLRPKHQDVDA